MEPSHQDENERKASGVPVSSTSDENEYSSSSSADTDTRSKLPLTEDDVIKIFQVHLDSPRDDPESMYEFGLCLHCIAYTISVDDYEINNTIGYLKHSAEMTRLGFIVPLTEEEIGEEEKGMNDFRAEKEELTELLDRARQLGRDQDVDAVTRACQLNMDIRRLVSLSEDEADSGRLDVVLRYMAEAINLIDQKHRVWPSWPELEESRREIEDSVELFGHEDRDLEAERLVLVNLLRLADNFLPPHAVEVCKYVKFHSQSLNQELAHIASFIMERSGDSYARVVGKLMSVYDNDMEFCQLNIEHSKIARTDLSTHWFGLRLYRLCLSVEAWDLADTVMKMSFDEGSSEDKEPVTDLLSQILSKVENNPPKQTDRILFEGEQDDVTSEYKLPELLTGVQESHQGTPWWVEEFRRRNTPAKSTQEAPIKGTTISSAASTLPPHTSGQRRFDLALEDLPAQTVLGAREANQQAARMFVTKNTVHDCDTYNIPFSYVTTHVDNPITLKWKDRNGEQQNATNIAIGLPYHCRVLTYHPIQDTWSVSSDMCRISGPLEVEKPGASCVPFVGDCGVNLDENTMLYKIHISRTDAMRTYIADVRTQNMALWYVNRFRKLTQDRFGVLVMLHSDCVVVYQDSKRDTILELMTREHHFQAGDSVKFDKYTSNASYRNEKVNIEILEAFSHFTHHDSSGTLMVTDIQGWVAWDRTGDNIKYTLTDPVIHCPGESYRFGETNLRHEGFDKFFWHVHPTCNHICESLKLNRSKEYRVPENPQSESDLNRRQKPRRWQSLPKRVSSRPTNNRYKSMRLDSA